MTQVFHIINETVRANCIKQIQSVPLEKFSVKIADKKSKRSTDQNALYWKWMQVIGDFMGQHKDDMHRTFAVRLLEPELFVVDGRQYVGAKSTSKLSVPEFTEYLERVQMTAIELGVVLPQPEYYGMER